jgi:hypothetical protein
VHAATLLALWLMWLLAGQTVGSPGQALWVGAAMLVGGLFAGRRFLILLRRLRWLLLAILLIFAFGTPGRLVIPDLPAGPTLEGLHAALCAMSKLVAMAGSVAVLMESLTPARLAGGIHRLVHPLSATPPAPDDFALRLQLVLHELDSRLPRRDWTYWLEACPDTQPVPVEPCERFSVSDLVLMAASAGLLVLWWLA